LGNAIYNKFNRGEVSDLALARDDVTKVNNSAAHIENFLPLRLGSMQYRPGTGYLGTQDGEVYFLPFTRSIDDQALLEFTNNQLKIWVDDEPINYPEDTTSITALTSWTPDTATTGGATINGSSWDIVLQEVGVDAGDAGYIYDTTTVTASETHVFKIEISEAPVTVHLGDEGAIYSDNIYKGELKPGVHYLSVTPSTTDMDVTISADKEYIAKVDSVSIVSDTDLELPTPVTKIESVSPLTAVNKSDTSCPAEASL